MLIENDIYKIIILKSKETYNGVVKDPDAGKSQKVGTRLALHVRRAVWWRCQCAAKSIFWALVRFELQHCSTVLHGVFG